MPSRKLKPPKFLKGAIRESLYCIIAKVNFRPKQSRKYNQESTQLISKTHAVTMLVGCKALLTLHTSHKRHVLRHPSGPGQCLKSMELFCSSMRPPASMFLGLAGKVCCLDSPRVLMKPEPSVSSQRQLSCCFSCW